MSRIVVVTLVVAVAGVWTACSGGSGDAARQAAPSQAAAPAQEAAPAGTPIPVPEFTVSTAAADIEKGKGLFASKGCVACHRADATKLVGPGLKGIFGRRDEVWIKKMILRPDIMVKEDATARKLLAEHMTPMPSQNVSPTDELPFIMAYLKSLE